MRWNNVWLLGSLVALLFSSSCKQQRELRILKPDNRKTQQIIEKLDSNQFLPSYLSFKASAEFKAKETSNSFKAMVRLKQDSAIWISVSAFGYEAVRLLATKDSVLLINRTEKSFFKGNYDFLNSRLNTNLNYEALERIVLGNAIGLADSANIKRSNAQGYYLLSSLNKRKLRRLTENPEKTKLDDVFYSNWIDPEYFRVAKMSILDVGNNQSATFTYTQFEPLGETQFARVMNVLLQSEEEVELQVEYSRLAVKDDLSLPFTIPSKYEPMVE